MKNLKKLKLILPLLFVAFLFSCNDSESNSINKDAPTISVRLVDAPGDFKAVNVEVVDVMIKMDNDSDDDTGWVSLESNSKIIDLLNLTGGVSEVLVDRFPIPAGTLSQMRLVLGDGNTIVIKNDSNEDETFDLKTPSAQQSGLKLKVDAVIEEGFTYDFIIDFDVEKSIVIAGNSGNIILKPVLYVSTEVSSGIIEGTVIPSDVPSMASVLVDDKGTSETEDDFIISALTSNTGTFTLWGVPAGTYDVIITPIDAADSDYAGGSATGVVITNGGITTITDSIELMFKPGSISGTISGSGLEEGSLVVATISINDADLTSVEANTEGAYAYLIDNVAPGDYTVTIAAEGYVTQNIDVTIGLDEDENLDVILVLTS